MIDLSFKKKYIYILAEGRVKNAAKIIQ